MKDLTLKDQTQQIILEHLATTEYLLTRAATQASGNEQTVEIVAMPDLGIPHNVQRIHGGFFTGALYKWTSSVPIVPVDATINVDGASVFRLRKQIATQSDFFKLIDNAIQKSQDGIYDWNFNQGNHFIVYGSVTGSKVIEDGYYLVLHSSASEFKNHRNGLYPSRDNWYYHEIKCIWHDNNRYIRYIEGNWADRFIKLAHSLEEFNKKRHRYFAELLFGKNNVIDELTGIFHYGMPSSSSVAIGCQWVIDNPLVLLLTDKNREMYFIKPERKGANDISIDGKNTLLYPHGLGKQSKSSLSIDYYKDSLLVNGTQYLLDASLENDSSLEIRPLSSSSDNDTLPNLIRDILSICPGEITARMVPLYAYDRTTNHAKPRI